MKKVWKNFNKLSTSCYVGDEDGHVNMDDWARAFDALVEAVAYERRQNKNFGQELLELDDELDYCADVVGWLLDFLDEIHMHGMHDMMICVCQKIIGLFQWKKDKPSEFRFRISTAMEEAGRLQEAYEYAKQWYDEDPQDIMAAAAAVYGRLGIEDFAGAKEIVDNFIKEDTKCGYDNDMMFAAAVTLYRCTGDKEAEMKADLERMRYDEELQQIIFGDDALSFTEDSLDADDWDMDDEELPFS